ncbi:acyl-ACP thioesterase [Nitratireductor mangrovi]|uniref:Acyl-ACP thioesterase n=1 Tax=Nitratireductor mangrovi TaxID=2599600 RepID=A0A5B8KY87_9HYPH|nr:thioesterase family protein [Nitratireductor mangrovi]QDZ00687.1 acyl-ACP thioesterase [Nitratireductor mangrovi]
MNGAVESHRSFINTWECDENAHLNVQFYLKRFDEAARVFAFQQAGRPLDDALPRVRHVRYHAELFAGATTRTVSGTIADGPYQRHVVHRLFNLESGKLAATALDTPLPGFRGCAVNAADVERALPRGVEPAPATPMTAEEVLSAGGLCTSRSIALPGECDAAGALTEQFYVGRFTDAAPHVWEQGGVGIAWLTQNGLGRVALEMKITHHQPARAGDGLMLYSLPSAFSGKTFHLRHEMKRMADGAPLVTGEIIAVILDLKTRKTVPLPETAGARPSNVALAD